MTRWVRKTLITSCELERHIKKDVQPPGWIKMILRELNKNPGDSPAIHTYSRFPSSITMSIEKVFIYT